MSIYISGFPFKRRGTEQDERREKQVLKNRKERTHLLLLCFKRPGRGASYQNFEEGQRVTKSWKSAFLPLPLFSSFYAKEEKRSISSCFSVLIKKQIEESLSYILKEKEERLQKL